jgi:O-antigen ligase
VYFNNVSVILPLAGIVVFSFVSSFIATAYSDVGPRYVMYPAYDAVIVLLAMLLPAREHHRRRFRLYLFGALVLLAGSVFVDAINPGTFSSVNTRAAGFPANPNIAAFVLVALCCLILDFERIEPLGVIALSLTSVGVLATLSRGGILMLAFVLVCYTYMMVRRKGRGRIRLLGAVAVVACLGSMIFLASEQLMQRASIFSLPSQNRQGMLLGRDAIVSPQEGRLRLLEESWALIHEAPILGFGSGFTYTTGEGPHNIYLQQWINNGIGGLICYLWLLIAATRLFWSRRSRAGLVFMGVVSLEGWVSHNLLEERVFLVSLGVLLTVSYFRAHDVGVASHSLVGHKRKYAARASLAAE